MLAERLALISLGDIDVTKLALIKCVFTFGRGWIVRGLGWLRGEDEKKGQRKKERGVIGNLSSPSNVG